MAIVASDLMSTRLVTLSPDMDLLQMDTVLFKRGVSGAPVVEGGVLVGVASQFDLVRTLWKGQHEMHERQVPDYSSPYPLPLSALEAMSREAPGVDEQLRSLRVRDVMTPDPILARPDDPLDVIADRMVNDQIHRLPVVEAGSGELVGIISTLDIVAAIRRYGLAAEA